MIGREGGLGGRCLAFVLIWWMSLRATRRTVRDEYSKMSSMFVCFEIVILIIVGTYSICLRGKNLALTHDALHQMSKIILC